MTTCPTWVACSGRNAGRAGRVRGERIFANARVRKRHIHGHCAVDEDCKLLLRQATDALGFSARAYDNILRVARTITDLDGAEGIAPHHISEAINYRTLDRRLE